MNKAIKLLGGFFLGSLMLLMASMSSTAYAVTRNVVASGGSTTSDCTSTACTLARANAVVQPGDVVVMATGNYHTTNIAPAVSGTAANRITYRGATNSVSVRTAALSSRAYITLDNLNFNSIVSGMVSTNAASDYLTITNCTFNSTDNGVEPSNYNYQGLSISGDYTVISNNTFLRWYGGDLIRIYGNYVTVTNNDFSKADSGHGILMLYGSNIIVRNNYFRNRWDRAWEISAKSGQYTENRLVENNIIFDSNWDNVYDYPASAVDGDIASEMGTDQLAKIGGSNSIIRNNLIVAGNIGKDYSYQSVFHIGNYDTAYWWEKGRIYHNTFHDNPRNGFYFNIRTSDGTLDCSLSPPNCIYMTDNVIKNNIISDQDYYSINFGSSLPTSIRNTHTVESNILTQSIYDINTVRTVSSFDSLYSWANNNISNAPVFQNPGASATAQADSTDNTKITMADYALASGSPGRGDGANPGAPLTTVTANATNATQISVADAYYFFDGYGLETGDSITIGGDVRTVTDVVSKTALQVTPAVTVASGDPIYLTAYGTSPPRGIVTTSTSSNVAPSVTITTVTDPNPDSTPSVTGSTSDSDGTVSTVQYQMNSTSGSWSSCSLASGNFTCNVSATLSNGINTIYVRATDDDGATTTSSDSFVVDTTAPSVSVTALSPDPTTDPTPTLSGTATDANSTVSVVSYQIDSTSGTWSNCTALDGTFDEAVEPFSCTVVPALSDGSYTIYFKATDVLSNATTSGYTQDSFEVANSTATWRFDADTAADYTYDSGLISVDANGAQTVSGVNKLNNPAFASNHTSWSVAAVNARSGWAVVPGSGTYSTSDFFVMQYEAKYDCNSDGVGDLAATCTAAADTGLGLDWRDVSQTTSNVVSSAQGAPIVHIRHNQATSACPAGTHLITNNEWMTIARNAEAQSSNWANGVVGSTIASGGGLKRGNVGTTDSTAYDGQDPEQGTSRNDKAKLVLSNGTEIWDMAGNVLEWTDNTIQRKDLPLAWNGTTDDATGNNYSDFSSGNTSRYIKNYKSGSSMQSSDVQPSSSSYNASHGVGKIYHYSDPNDTSTSVFAYERGGYWIELSHGGVFSLRAQHLASYLANNVGYRCATGASTTQTYSGTSGRNSGGGETVAATTISDVKLYQSVNVGDTSTYDLSVYVYDSTSGNDGGTVSSSVAELFYNGSAISTTYTNIGSGWWKLSGTLTGANASREYGVLVKAGKTVKTDDFTLSKSGTYSIYNTTAHSVSGIQSWDSFSAVDTASGNASIKYQICTDDGSACQTNSTWKYWDGDSWEAASNTTTHVNTEAELTATAMQALPVDTEKISVKSVMSFGGADTPDLDSITVTSTTDTAAPIVSLTAFVPDPTTDTTPTLTGTVTDDLGTVTTVQYQVDSTAGTWNSCTSDDGTFDESSEAFSCTVSPALADGEHEIFVRATDNLSNTTPSGGEQSDVLSVDTTGPTTPGTPTTESPSDNPTPAWTWTASTDAIAGLDSTPYTIEWSTDNTFTNSVSSIADVPNSFTHSVALEDGTWYIRVKATDTLGNESSYSSTGSITIDSTDPVPPEVSLTAYTPDPGTDSTPSITGTTSDSDSTISLVEYQVDSTTGLWTACSADDGAFDEAVDPFTCTVSSALSDGAHTIYVHAIDSDDQTSAAASDSFTIDTTAPSVSVTAVSPDPTSDSTPTLTGTVTDATGTVSAVSYQADGTEGSWNSCTADDGAFDEASETFSCTVSPALNDGNHTIYFKAADALSNETSSGHQSDTFTVDTTGPTTPGTPSSASPENDTTPTWSWTASTDSGVGLAGVPYTVEWSTDNTFATGVSTDTANTNSYTHSVELADGTWYMRVKAEDTLGNESSYSSAGSFIVDTVIPPTDPPTLSLTAVSPDPGTDTTPTLTGTAADPDGTIAEVEYQVDSNMGTWTACTADDGTFDEASETFSCTVSPALNDGSHTLYVRATADDDQLVEESDTFVIDTAAPTTPGTPSTTTPTTDTTPTWTWTASTDSGVGLDVPAYTVEWSTSSDFSSGVSTDTATTATFTHSSALAEGTWYFRVKADDDLNNESSYSSNGSVVIDTSAPTSPGTPSTTTPTTDTTPTWTWTASSDSGVGLAASAYTVQWSTSSSFASDVSSSTATSATFTHSSELADGTWYFRVKAVDSLGNETSYTSNGTVVVDTGNPTAPGTPSTTSPTNSTSQTWNWTAASDSVTSVAEYAWRVVTNLGAAVTNGTTAATSVVTNLTEGVYTFFVKSVDEVDNESTESSGTVTVDTTAPTISLTAHAEDPTADTTPTFTGTATDAMTALTAIEYRVDSGTWTACTALDGTIDELIEPYSCTVSPALTDATYTISVRATDTASNTTSGGGLGTDELTIDTTAPSVPGTPSSASNADDNTPAWTWTASTDTVGLDTTPYIVQWSTDSSFESGAEDTTTTNSFTHVTELADGTWYFKVKAVDLAGNESDYSTAGSFIVDAVPEPVAPDIVVDPYEDPTADVTPELKGTASDSDGTIASVEYQVDSTSGSWSACTADDGTFDEGSEPYTCSVASALTEGSHTVYVRTTDSDTAVSSNGSDTFYVDLTAPVISVTAYTPDPTPDNTPTVVGTVSDANSSVSSVSHQADATDGSWSSCTTENGTFSCTLASLSDGSHTIYFKAADALGNETSASYPSETFTIDASAPTAPGTPSTTSPTTDTTPSWSWTASTDSGVGLAATPYTVEWSEDSNFSTGVTSVTAATNSFTHSSALTDGTWNFRVKAEDDLGNESSFSNYGVVIVDTGNPVAPGTPSTTDPTNSTTQNWSWSAGSDPVSGVAEYAWRVVTNLGAAVTNGTTSVTNAVTNLTQGLYSFFVKTVDNAGNESSESSSDITVDTTVPTLTFPALTPDPTTDATPSFSGNATDNLTALTAIEYRIDAGSWSSCTADDGVIDEINEDFTCTVSTLSDASYTISVRATDTAGNVNTGGSIATDTFTVDASAPSAPGTPSTSSSSDDSTPTWTWTASTDSGVGLASPAYTVQWSTSSDFSSGVNTGTATSNSFTHSSALTSGTWYFRVKAADTLGNESSYSSAGSFEYVGPFAISNVEVAAEETSATVTWSTNIAASTQVSYGLISTDTTTTETDTSPRTQNHTATISSLASCTRYVFTVRSETADSTEATSTESNFITAGCTGDSETFESTSSQVSNTEEETITLNISGSQAASLLVPQDVSANSSLVFQLFRLSRASVVSETGIPTGFSSIVNDHVYELRAMSGLATAVTSFDEPITFTISYTDAGIQGYQESSLALYRWNGSSWQALSSCTQDTFNNTLSCTTTSFSTFAMVGSETSTASGSTSRTTSSGTSSDTCSEIPPTSVPQIYQINVARGSAQLYINPASGNTTEYTVQYGLTPTEMMYATTFVQTRPTGAVVHTIHSLSPNTNYYFKVQAKNGCAVTDFGSAFGTKTTRFFWQRQMRTESVGTPAVTDSISPTPSVTPLAPTAEQPPEVVPTEAPAQVTPISSATPRPTPTADTTRSVPAPTDVAPSGSPSFWQWLRGLVSNIF